MLTLTTSNAQNPQSEAPFETYDKGKLKFNAKSVKHGISIGDYIIAWDITPTKYTINTSLTASTFLSIFVSFGLEEVSTGDIHGQDFYWQQYTLRKTDSDNDNKDSVRKVIRVDNNHVMIKGITETVLLQPLDIPSAILLIKNYMANPKVADNWQLPMTLLTSRSQVDVVMKRLADETIKVPLGKFSTRVVRGEAEKKGQKVFLHIWFDQITHKPVKIVFTNSKGNKFLLSLEKVL